MTSRVFVVSAAIAAHALTGAVTRADLVTFDLTWAGLGGSAASATGSITIDDASGALSSPGFTDYYGAIAGSAFSDFTITITDAASGNGTFTQAGGDFFEVAFTTFGVLDLSQDLVGQANFYDFNVFTSIGAGAPKGTGLFKLSTSEGLGDQLVLTSMTVRAAAVVPLPSAAWAGLGLLGIMGVKRRMSR